MKAASTALNALLAQLQTVGGTLYVADLYTVTRLDGSVLYWTSWEVPLTVNGHTYLAYGPRVSRGKVTVKVGFEVDTMELDLNADPSVMLPGESIPVLQDFVQDKFAGAEVILDRLFMGTPGDVSNGTFRWFVGSMGDMEIGRAHAKISVDSEVKKLNVQTPRTILTPGCRFTLYDSYCGVSRASFTTTSTIATGGNLYTLQTNLTPPAGTVNPPTSAPGLSQASNSSANLPAQTYFAVVTYVSAYGETIASPEAAYNVSANSILTVDSPPSEAGVTGYNVYVGYGSGGEALQNQAPIAIGTNWTMSTGGIGQGAPPPLTSTTGYWSQGVVTITSGVMAGVSRNILGSTGGALTLVTGLPQIPATGVAISVVPGCDKLQTTCQQKFNNLVRFGGMPYVPQPEAAI